MAKKKLGSKWVCGSCGCRFYDLGRSPRSCPKCGTVVDAATTAAIARRRSFVQEDDQGEAEFDAADKATSEAEAVADDPVIGAVPLEDDDESDEDSEELDLMTDDAEKEADSEDDDADEDDEDEDDDFDDAASSDDTEGDLR